VRAWLMQVSLGEPILQEQSAIRLRIGQATYPIELIQEQGPMVSAEVQSYPLYPLWRDVTYLPRRKTTMLMQRLQPTLRLQFVYRNVLTAVQSWCPSIRLRVAWDAPRR